MLGTLEAESVSSGFCRLQELPCPVWWTETLPAGVTRAPGVTVTEHGPAFLGLALTQPGAAFSLGALLGSWIHLGRRLADPLTVLCPEVISLLRRGRKGPQGLWHSCRPGPTGQWPEDWVSLKPLGRTLLEGLTGLGWSPQAPPQVADLSASGQQDPTIPSSAGCPSASLSRGIGAQECGQCCPRSLLKTRPTPTFSRN